MIRTLGAPWIAHGYSQNVEELAKRRQGPFLVLAALFIAICIVVIAIPEPALVQLRDNRPLTAQQAGWAYRLLAFFAIGQVIYTGMAVFRIDRVSRLRSIDERFARLSKPALVTSMARNAAVLVVFTLVYGIAALILTGQRGGFWLFPVLAVAQGAWYYREIGQVAQWKALQPDDIARGPDAGWSMGGPDYCPPIARGLTPLVSAVRLPD